MTSLFSVRFTHWYIQGRLWHLASILLINIIHRNIIHRLIIDGRRVGRRVLEAGVRVRTEFFQYDNDLSKRNILASSGMCCFRLRSQDIDVPLRLSPWSETLHNREKYTCRCSVLARDFDIFTAEHFEILEILLVRSAVVSIEVVICSSGVALRIDEDTRNI